MMSVTFRLHLAAAALLAVALTAPARAQTRIAPEDECARAPSTEEEVTCLRQALAASREASRPAEPEATREPERPRPRRESITVRATDTLPALPRIALGEEQLPHARQADAAGGKSEVMQARVTDFRTDGRGLLVMQLDNGQVWRQDETLGRPIRLDQGQRVGVEITRSGFGGYRMRFPDLRQRIAVSRLR